MLQPSVPACSLEAPCELPCSAAFGPRHLHKKERIDIEVDFLPSYLDRLWSSLTLWLILPFLSFPQFTVAFWIKAQRSSKSIQRGKGPDCFRWLLRIHVRINPWRVGWAMVSYGELWWARVQKVHAWFQVLCGERDRRWYETPQLAKPIIPVRTSRIHNIFHHIPGFLGVIWYWNAHGSNLSSSNRVLRITEPCDFLPLPSLASPACWSHLLCRKAKQSQSHTLKLWSKSSDFHFETCILWDVFFVFPEPLYREYGTSRRNTQKISEGYKIINSSRTSVCNLRLCNMQLTILN